MKDVVACHALCSVVVVGLDLFEFEVDKVIGIKGALLLDLFDNHLGFWTIF